MDVFEDGANFVIAEGDGDCHVEAPNTIEIKRAGNTKMSNRRILRGSFLGRGKPVSVGMPSRVAFKSRTSSGEGWLVQAFYAEDVQRVMAGESASMAVLRTRTRPYHAKRLND
jgi:hypothetical protein